MQPSVAYRAVLLAEPNVTKVSHAMALASAELSREGG
jgi:hypothetical protein